MLNRVLADEHMLYTQLRNFHWNVEGVHFRTFHALFEEQYDAVKIIADDVAERIRMLGGNAIGTLREFLDTTTLEEAPDEYPAADTMVERLVQTHERIIVNLRQDIASSTAHFEDEGTADLLTAIMRQHEAMAWMLRSTLAG